jgi:hypothetical protein
MALARVVEFEGVSQQRIDELKGQIESGDPPEGLKATEIILLFDAAAEKSTVVVFFDNEDDYRRGDEILSAMPADEVPGRRASVTKYEVVGRRTA